MIYRIIDLKESLYDEKLFKKAYKEMSSQRQEKADRYKQESDRKACVFADMLLRQMLKEAGYTQTPVFYKDEKGKPHLENDELYFSISHSGEFVACAVSRHPVGIDIEKKRLVDLPLIKRVCTEEELSFVLSGSTDITEGGCERFLTLWCLKEAYLKYTGEGLVGGLKSISFADNGKIKENPLPHIKAESLRTEEYICAVISEKNKVSEL
ncbi:MAG: 4'-phosphopantetheinyl transferase superfamily protein [Ruminococcus sp.]|nr:4'-phosphopantetheinyl transferase superfamily protein [Ruminococcus sp.]